MIEKIKNQWNKIDLWYANLGEDEMILLWVLGGVCFWGSFLGNFLAYILSF